MKSVLLLLLISCVGCTAARDDVRTDDVSESLACATCESMPQEWRWDVDEDGQTDFLFSYSCGKTPESREAESCGAALFGSRLDRWGWRNPADDPRVMHPVELGERIDSKFKPERWRTSVGLADLSCGEPGRWRGLFADATGSILAFQMPIGDATVVGWARIRVDECTGEITIPELYFADEREGVFVGEYGNGA